MHRDIAAELRHIVQEQLLPGSSLGQALTAIADHIEAQDRATAAIVERLEQLEAEVLPRAVDVP